MGTPAEGLPPEATFIETRLALHSVAEHVLCAARHAATGRIGLRSAPDGFTTPPFPSPNGDRTVAVVGVDLVVRDDRGERRAPLTTVGAAAAAAEITPGAPTDLFTPTTPLAVDEPLAIDPVVAATLARWWHLTANAFTAFAAEQVGVSPEPAQLWPEHFDLGGQVGEVNYGGSPGDSGHQMPYLYVGPWSPPEQDDFWNRPFGALVASADVPDVAAALDFFREGQRRLIADG